MAMKPTWKGTLKLAFVSQPVAIYGAKETKTGIEFNQIHTCGHKLNTKQHCAHCAKDVPSEDVRKGFEFQKGSWITIDAAAVKGCEVETSKVIELQEFVPLSEVKPYYIEQSHYIAPEDPTLCDAFALIRDALDGMAGIATLARGGKEYLVAIVANGRGLTMHTLRHQEDIRDIAGIDVLSQVPASTDAATLGLMKQLVTAKTTDRLALEKYPNTYRDNVKALIAKTIAGDETTVEQVAPEAKKTNDLAAMLRASLALVDKQTAA